MAARWPSAAARRLAFLVVGAASAGDGAPTPGRRRGVTTTASATRTATAIVKIHRQRSSMLRSAASICCCCVVGTDWRRPAPSTPTKPPLRHRRGTSSTKLSEKNKKQNKGNNHGPVDGDEVDAEADDDEDDKGDRFERERRSSTLRDIWAVGGHHLAGGRVRCTGVDQTAGRTVPSGFSAFFFSLSLCNTLYFSLDLPGFT